jgi:beta-N-acetylhexosaminidase
MVKLLREDLGFQGVILSDSMNMKGATGEDLSLEEAALQAVKAGVDLLLVSTPGSAQPAYERLLAAAQSGELSMNRIDDSLRRVLSLKAERNLASFPLPTPPDPNWQENTRVSDEVGRRAVTLMKNDGNLVPISPSVRRILILGPQEEWDFYTRLESALRAQGHSVESFYYPIPTKGPLPNPAELESLSSKAADFDLILMFTWQAYLNQIQFGGTFQPELAQKLSSSGWPLIVVALKSPTDILSLPAVPAYLATFGTTSGQLQSALDILTGAARPLGQNPLPGLIK